MAPSLRGVITLGANSSLLTNTVYPLNKSEKARLAATASNISITAARISSSNNQTHISVTVRDNSNSSVALRQLLLMGNLSAYAAVMQVTPNVPPSINNISSSYLLNQTLAAIGRAIGLIANGTSNFNAFNSIISNLNISQIENLGSSFGLSKSQEAAIAAKYILNGSIPGVGKLGANLNATAQEGLLQGIIGNLTNSSYANSLKGDNLSVMETALSNQLSNGNLSRANLTGILDIIANAKAQAQLNRARQIAAQQRSLGLVSFIVEVNRTIGLPSSLASLQSPSYGYLLSPGASVNLTFNGYLSLDDGRVLVAPANGKNYKLEVIGDNGASGSINATAT